MIIRVPWLPRFSGITLHPRLIIVRRDTSAAILLHEQAHAAQMESDGWLRFWWRYAFSRKHRLHYEAAAYAVSVKNGDDLQACANFLAANYCLGVSPERALSAIKQHLQP